MNVWEYLDSQNTNHLSQYKKWLDVSSSHFSFISINESDFSFKNQKKIAKKAIEEHRETGNDLLYLSSEFYYENELGQLVPIFIIPISPEISHKNKSINWKPKYSVYASNREVINEDIELEPNDLDSYLNKSNNLEKSKIFKSSIALFFNSNVKKFIQNDLAALKEKRELSGAISSLFHLDIKKSKESTIAQFLDYSHVYALDHSQAKAIEYGKRDSMVISGPPGTGKSQTIVNLAIDELKTGKKVAIISQKKAAIEVLIQRFRKLEFQNFFLNTIDQENIIQNIEKSFQSILEYQPSEIVPKFNLVYFNHSIRTLEDYYQSKTAYQNSRKTQINLDLSKNYDEIEVLNWIFPHSTLISIDFVQIQDLLHRLYQLLETVDLDFDKQKFDFLLKLNQVFEFVKELDFDEIKDYLKDKKSDSHLISIHKKIKLHEKSKPELSSNLHQLSAEKLDFLKMHISKSNFISDLFNRKANILISEVKSLCPNWSRYNIWEKEALISDSIAYQKWKNEYQKLEVELSVNQISDRGGAKVEVLSYIENKIKSKLQEWEIGFKYWIKSKNFEKSKSNWKKLFDIIHEIIAIQPQFQELEIEEFKHKFKIENQSEIQKSEWEKLCSQNFGSLYEWKSRAKKNSDSIHQFPILTNYSVRDIANHKAFVRKLYKDFQNYNRQLICENLLSKKSKFYSQLMSSRKSDTKFQRDIWKKNTIFLQKNWSKKRSKPSPYQFIKQIDFEFLLWLNPLFLGTIDQFSQFTELEREAFDTLIIDESSQVELIDVLPALYRAKKVIVVGDSQQLSPMRFFRLNDIQSKNYYESILELAEEKLPIYQLNYHYRSVFSDLIAFSNFHFYDSSLKSTLKNDKNAIERIHCPKGIYHQRSNAVEAKQIVESLKSLRKFHTTESVGIICFSTQQRDMIENEIEDERLRDFEFNRFILKLESHSEYLFIRSIEHVQGDERDIVYISTGYAPNPEGKFYQYFGPILTFKGENRINVMMSRARLKIYFITSIHSSMIHIQPSSSKGLTIFKKLFEFIEQKNISLEQSKQKPSNYWEYYLNPFRK